jgi:hypothetical protein
MKSYEDQKLCAGEFVEGDWVWMRLQRCTAMAITTAHSKLNMKFYGPYKVLKRIGMVAYQLELPPHAKIHDVFHVTLLKKYEGLVFHVTLLKKYEGPASTQPIPLPDLLHSRVLPTLDTVLRAQLNRGVWELLVKWTGRCTAQCGSSLKTSKCSFHKLSSRMSFLSTRGEMR